MRLSWGGGDSQNSISIENPCYTSEWLKANTNIHGWLSFFFVAILVGGLLSAIYPFATYDDEYASILWLYSCDIIIGLSLFGIAIYTVYAFVKRKPNAVFYGRFYLIMIFASNVMPFLVALFEFSVIQVSPEEIRSIVFSIIWFLYLLFSKQVREVIPKPFRKARVIDWVIVGILLAIPSVCFYLGEIQLYGILEEMNDVELADLELEIPIEEMNRR